MSKLPAFSLKSFMQKQASAKQNAPPKNNSEMFSNNVQFYDRVPQTMVTTSYVTSKPTFSNFSGSPLNPTGPPNPSRSWSVQSQNPGFASISNVAPNTDNYVSSLGNRCEKAYNLMFADGQYAAEISPRFHESSKVAETVAQESSNFDLESYREYTGERLFSRSSPLLRFGDVVPVDVPTPDPKKLTPPGHIFAESDSKNKLQFCFPEREVTESSRVKNPPFTDSWQDRSVLKARNPSAYGKQSTPVALGGTNQSNENFSLFKMTEMLSDISRKAEEISALQLKNEEEFNWVEMHTRIQRLMDAQKPVAEALQKLLDDSLENPPQVPSNEKPRSCVNVIDLSLAAPVSAETGDCSDSEPEIFWSKGSFSKPNLPKQRILSGAIPEFRSSGNIDSPPPIPAPLFSLEETPQTGISTDIVTIEDDVIAGTKSRISLLPRVDVVTID